MLTLGALIGTAAHLEGLGVTALDFTGLAQKNGAVSSHLRIARTPDALHAVRLAPGGADLLIAADLVAACAEPSLSRLEHGRTQVLASSDLTPTASFVIDGSETGADALLATLRAACGEAQVRTFAASRLAQALAGDAIAANLLLLGAAFQRGLLPLSLAAIERAIVLNGVAVAANRRAFAWGRVAAHDPLRVAARLQPPPAPAPSLDAFVDARAQDLEAYQDAAYAQRYRARIAALRAAEHARGGGAGGLAEAAALGLYRLMAYKDEYEVARLYRAPAFRAQLAALFDGDAGALPLEFHLTLPWARGTGPDGRPAKRRVGRWMWHAFALLAHGRRLRGSAFDPFGRSAERRLERRLRDAHEALLDEITRTLTPARHALALDLLQLPQRIRGFGPVKQAAAEAVAREQAALLARYRAAGAHAPSAVQAPAEAVSP